MSLSLPLFVGLRYLRPKGDNRFIGFTTLSSILGIGLGMVALITVISVMNGFEQELRKRILGVAGHLLVTGPEQRLADWPTLARRVAEFPQVTGAAPYVEGQGLLTRGTLDRGVLVRGIDPALQTQVSDLHRHMVAGRPDALAPGAFGIVLGKELADALGAGVGDRVTLVTPQANVTPAGILPRLRRFTVVGVFRMGMYEYDGNLALVHLDDAAKLFRFGDRVSGVRFRLSDLFAAPDLARRLTREFGDRYEVSDWTRRHANFFGAVRTEKTVMFVILSLIVAVAAFNIVSTLVMVVTEKEADIAILRTMGVSPRRIMAVFFVPGGVIGLLGTLSGLIGGVALALHVSEVVGFFEGLFGAELLPADLYYITRLPSELRWGDVAWIGALALLLSLAATLYPAWRAARVEPARALRYE